MKQPPFSLALENLIIPIANISHITRPDDTTHIVLKNNLDIKVKLDDDGWRALKEIMTA